MRKQNRRKPLFLENIEIIDTANKGKSVAKHDSRVIFIQGGVPGDICDITVLKRRKAACLPKKKHYFCKKCGIYTFHQTLRQPGFYKANIGCLEGVDSSVIEVINFDGKNLL